MTVLYDTDPLSKVPLKYCPGCQQSLPCTVLYFYRNASRPDGFSSACKQCDNTRLTTFKQANLAHWHEIDRKKCATYRAKHRQEYNARQRAYFATHPESTLAKKRRRRARQAGAPLNDLTVAQWREIKAVYGYKCVYCGRKMERLTMDHITPLSRGGSHTANNIVPACQSCNARKHDGKVLIPVQPLLLTVAPARGV